MRPEIRAAKDVAAMSELAEWCAPLSLTIDDNGCEIIIRANGFPVKKACYRRPWCDELDRSRGAAYRELIRYIAGGGWLRVSAARELKNPDGSFYYDSRTYEFRIPECASPGELAIKLAAKGWRMPETVWQDAV
jgi:hypothetical protein